MFDPTEALNVSVWIVVSLALLGAGWLLVDVLTPGDLRKQISASVNAATLVAGRLLGSATVIFAAIGLSDDALATGLVQATVYSLAGLAAAAVTFLLVDALLPAKVRNLVNEPKFNPAVLVAAAADVSVALVIAAAIS